MHHRKRQVLVKWAGFDLLSATWDLFDFKMFFALIDTVLPKKRVTRRLAAATAATRQRTRDVWHLKARFAAFGAMADKHCRIGASRAR